MQGQEIRYNNARIRVHFPDRTKEEQTAIVKAATEVFLKKAVMNQAKGDRNNGH